MSDGKQELSPPLDDLGSLPAGFLIVSTSESDEIVTKAVARFERFTRPDLALDLIEQHREAIALTKRLHDTCGAVLQSVEEAAQPPLSPRESVIQAGLLLDQSIEDHVPPFALDLIQRVNELARAALVLHIESGQKMALDDIVNTGLGAEDRSLKPAVDLRISLLVLKQEQIAGHRALTKAISELLRIWRGAFYRLLLQRGGGAFEQRISKRTRAEGIRGLLKMILGVVDVLDVVFKVEEFVESAIKLVDCERELTEFVDDLAAARRYIIVFNQAAAQWHSLCAHMVDAFVATRRLELSYGAPQP